MPGISSSASRLSQDRHLKKVSALCVEFVKLLEIDRDDLFGSLTLSSRPSRFSACNIEKNWDGPGYEATLLLQVCVTLSLESDKIHTLRSTVLR